MNNEEFLEMCRLATVAGTGGQWTEEKIAAVEAVKSDATGVVSRLLDILREAQATKQVAIYRRLEDGYWLMRRGDTRMIVEAGAPQLGDTLGVTVRVVYGTLSFVVVELDADSAAGLELWLRQWRRIREQRHD